MPLSRLGLGAAEVELEFPDRLHAGETAEATLTVEGGSSDQNVHTVTSTLMAEYMVDGRSIEVEVTEFVNEKNFTIHSGEYREFEVEFDVPVNAPVTRGSVKAWVETELHIDWSSNPSDRDNVSIRPEEYVASMFDAFDELGFDFADSVLIGTSDAHSLDADEYLQDYEFHPFVSPYEEELDDVEVIAYPQEDRLDNVFGVNRNEGALHRFTGESSDTVEVAFESTDVDEMAEQIREVLATYGAVAEE